ncbi:hypothetical protein HMPREF3293_01563 [Christensenella minuta]|uniref:Uncharacterized protein n=1 Tax=Christensenella minuta TaxID=626937 RepID=A0A136Q4Q7_9FIRM|nr:hypothetical protein HMPREF3293_01563 [Christensenella minuta]
MRRDQGKTVEIRRRKVRGLNCLQHGSRLPFEPAQKKRSKFVPSAEKGTERGK